MLTENQITELRKVRDIILGTPKQFIMRDWAGNRYHRYVEGSTGACGFNTLVSNHPKIPNCGTAACIRGWLECSVKQLKPSQARIFWGQKDPIELNPKQSEKLYYFAKWPAKFKRAKTEGTPAFARQAARRIDHFIATNGEE